MLRIAIGPMITRVAAGLVGTVAVLSAGWQLWRGVPVQQAHAPLHTDVMFAPIGILVGSALILIALAPRRWW
jgi:hypothetical protein